MSEPNCAFGQAKGSQVVKRDPESLTSAPHNQFMVLACKAPEFKFVIFVLAFGAWSYV